jgi:molecular chaperone GrpE (heat shock protein)
LPNEDLPLNENRVNVEYYRKLNQQLIQKDNIIKLLQLKLKNFETQPDRAGPPIASGAPPHEFGRMTVSSELALPPPLPSSTPSESQTLKNLVEELKTQAREQGEALEQREREVAELKKMVIELRDRSGRISLVESEVFELRKALRDRDLLIAELREQVERRVVPPSADPDPLLMEAIEERSREVERLEREKLDLVEKIHQMETAATPPRTAERPVPTTGNVLGPLMSILAEVAALGQGGSLDRERLERLEGRLEALASRLGIRRVRTVGQPYDPAVHQAVEYVNSCDHPHNAVVREKAPGFVSDCGLSRIADVVVNQNPRFCPSCEQLAVEGSKFCNHCGGRLSTAGEGLPQIRDTAQLTRSHVELGIGFERAQDPATARIHFEKALELEPSSSEAALGLIRLEERAGHYDQALSRIDDLTDRHDDPRDLEPLRRRLLLKREILDKLVNLV